MSHVRPSDPTVVKRLEFNRDLDEVVRLYESLEKVVCTDVWPLVDDLKLKKSDPLINHLLGLAKLEELQFFVEPLSQLGADMDLLGSDGLRQLKTIYEHMRNRTPANPQLRIYLQGVWVNGSLAPLAEQLQETNSAFVDLFILHFLHLHYLEHAAHRYLERAALRVNQRVDPVLPISSCSKVLLDYVLISVPMFEPNLAAELGTFFRLKYPFIDEVIAS